VACIPAYNEERNIAKVIVGAMSHVDQVIVCDDGSQDMTAKIAEKLGAIVVSHKRNLGYGAAIASLFETARQMKVDIMVTLDGDGQHDPSRIPAIIQPIIEGKAHIVVGSRFLDPSQSKENNNGNNLSSYRKFGIKAITKISNIVTQTGLTDSQSGFRAYDRKAIQEIRVTEQGMGASTEILFRAQGNHFSILEVPISVDYSDTGETSTHNSVYHGVDVIISTIKFVSIDHPLRFYGIPGLACIAIAIYFGIIAIQTYTEGGRLITNVALTSIGFLITGVVLMATAVILYVIINVVRDSRRI